jgi:hypothetical protein
MLGYLRDNASDRGRMNWAVVSQLTVDTWNAKPNPPVERGFRHPIRESSMHTIGPSGMGEATNKRAPCRATWCSFSYHTAASNRTDVQHGVWLSTTQNADSYFLKTKRSENGTHILIKYKYFLVWSKSNSNFNFN